MNKQLHRLLKQIREELRAQTGDDADANPDGPVTHGQINRGLCIRHGSARYYVKLNSARNRDMFEAEWAGLDELAAPGIIRVPKPVCCGDDGTTAFLVMEYMDFRTRGDPAALGERLAQLHLVGAEKFGWKRDNTIGLTPQLNAFSDDWLQFWSSQRLAYQFDLAARNGFSGSLQRKGEMLMDGLHLLFEGYTPRPALLHGDLWCGNYAYLESGEPVIFDPAVYFGDHETDLAMTELFGGFGQEFYAAYRSSVTVDAGYTVRRHMYMLYHILNHLNLFGHGYLSQAESKLDLLLGELR